MGRLNTLILCAFVAAWAPAFPSAALAEGSSGGEGGEKLVVASVLPVYISAINVIGDRARVELLVPPGTDVHEFQLGPSRARALHSADLILINGASLEGFLRSDARVVDTSKGVPLIKTGSAVDPHVWLDPLNVMKQVENIRDAIAAIDPENRGYYEANAARYTDALGRLDSELKEGFPGVKTRHIITYHEVFNYFADRYGFKTYSVTGPQGAQAGPGRLRAIYDIVEKEGVPAVFSEAGLRPSRGLQRLKQDLGVRICVLDTVVDGKADAGRYIEAMRGNLEEIIKCLGR